MFSREFARAHRKIKIKNVVAFALCCRLVARILREFAGFPPRTVRVRFRVTVASTRQWYIVGIHEQGSRRGLNRLVSRPLAAPPSFLLFFVHFFRVFRGFTFSLL